MKNKKSLIFLCTHLINKAVISEYEKIKNSYPENFDAILLINNETVKLDYNYGIHELEFFDEKIKCLLFDKTLNDLLGLECDLTNNGDFAEAMWYNSDYKYYYVKYFFPDYEYYWYTEYDVYCNGDSYKPFLLKYDSMSEDLLIPHFRELQNETWCWIEGSSWAYNDKKMYGSFFPISRISSNAIDFLYQRRKELIKQYSVQNKLSTRNSDKWIFCELFVPTELVNGYFTANKIEEENIRLEPFDLNEERIFEKPDYRLYHPIKTTKQLEDKYKIMYRNSAIKKFRFLNLQISFEKIKERA